MLLFMACSSSPEKAQNRLKANADFPNWAVDSIAQYAARFPDDTELAIAHMSQNKVAFYGIKRTNGELVNTQNHQSIFQLGSLTKVLTGHLFLNKVNQQDFPVDTAISAFLPFPVKKEASNITLRQLVNHTSGLPKFAKEQGIWQHLTNANPYTDYRRTDLPDFMAHQVAIESVPGHRYAYSPMGYALLAEIMEITQNKPFEQIFYSSLVEKYQLENTGLIDQSSPSEIMPPRDKNGKITDAWTYGDLQAAAGAYSNVQDLSKWLKNWWQNEELQALIQKDAFRINDHFQSGLSWHLMSESRTDASPLFWHNGSTKGFTNSMAFEPKQQHGIIILANLSGKSPKSAAIDYLCTGLVRGFLSE